MKRVAPILAIVAVLAACGGSGGSESAPASTALTKGAAMASTTVPPRPAPTTIARATTLPPATTAPAVKTSTTVAPATITPTTVASATTRPTTVAPVTTVASAPATGSNACTDKGPCKVGQTGPAGGIVFYVAATPQRWGQYMEVRPTAFEQIKYDSCNLDAYATYSAGKIGDGTIQTAAVIAACAKDGKPAGAGSYARVAGYSQGGLGGWFIPSKSELQALLDSKVVTFPTTQDLTSGTWVNKPQAAGNRSFDVLYGLKKEVLAGTAPYSRGGTVRTVEVMSDGTQSYGNPNNRWGWIYIARPFGPKG